MLSLNTSIRQIDERIDMAYQGKNFEPGYNSNNPFIRHNARRRADRKRLLSGGDTRLHRSTYSSSNSSISIPEKKEKKELDVGDVIMGIINLFR